MALSDETKALLGGAAAGVGTALFAKYARINAGAAMLLSAGASYGAYRLLKRPAQPAPQVDIGQAQIEQPSPTGEDMLVRAQFKVKQPSRMWKRY